MKTIKSVDVGSFVLYGALLALLWTLVFSLIYWILGWLFGATSWWIDMDLVNWSIYSLTTFFFVIWRSLVNGVTGALAGLVVAVVYNLVAGVMGGIKIKLE
jgi:hypothetical protein